MKPASLVVLGLLTVAFVVLGATAASAQAPAASPRDLQQMLKVDETVTVLVAGSGQIQGAVKQVTDTALALWTGRGTEVLPIERIREVTVKRRDPVWNGLLIGLGIGALAGLIPDYYDDCAECHDSLYASMAIGAGAGLLADALVRQSRLLYRAPTGDASLSLGFRMSRQGTGAELRFRF